MICHLYPNPQLLTYHHQFQKKKKKKEGEKKKSFSVVYCKRWLLVAKGK